MSITALDPRDLLVHLREWLMRHRELNTLPFGDSDTLDFAGVVIPEWDVRQRLDEIEASIAGGGRTSSSPAEWQPMSTAPTTGQTVLVFGPHGEPYTAYFDWVQNDWCDRAFRDRCEPDWWMPLPVHPSVQMLRNTKADA